MNLKHIGESLQVSERHLPKSQFDGVTMSGAVSKNARVETIDDIVVTDMLAAYRQVGPATMTRSE